MLVSRLHLAAQFRYFCLCSSVARSFWMLIMLIHIPVFHPRLYIICRKVADFIAVIAFYGRPWLILSSFSPRIAMISESFLGRVLPDPPGRPAKDDSIYIPIEYLQQWHDWRFFWVGESRFFQFFRFRHFERVLLRPFLVSNATSIHWIIPSVRHGLQCHKSWDRLSLWEG